MFFFSFRYEFNGRMPTFRSVWILFHITVSTLFRSTSMRTMSALNSRAGTPKTGTLNSNDLYFGHHASFSASGGSRTLDRVCGGGRVGSFDRALNSSDGRSDESQTRSFQTFQVRRPPTMSSPAQSLSCASPPSAVGDNHNFRSIERPDGNHQGW